METTYRVSGLTCGHCVKHVLEEVTAIPGVTDATLTLDGELTLISAEPIDFDRIVEAAAEAGDYSVE